jgi:hypothetical protein
MGHAAPAKRLHRMKRARGGAAASQRFENAAVERAAGMQSDFAKAFVAAHYREFARRRFERAVGSSKKNHIGTKSLPRQSRVRRAGADRADGSAR